MTEAGWTAGQWAVLRPWAGSWEAVQISRVTAQMVFSKSGYRSGDRRHDKASVKFAGTETEAKALVEVLTSLEGRRIAAERQIADQHKARVEAAISAALAKGASK